MTAGTVDGTTGAHEPAPLELGVILKPHGLRGEVKVKLHFAGSDSFDHARHVLLVAPDGKRSTRRVLSVRPTGKAILLGLEGVDDCNAAEALRGSRLLVERSELPPLEPGEYYLADLVGCRVELTEAGGGPRLIGVVKQVRPDPSVDTLVIEKPDGTTVEQPLGDAWVGAVDVAARHIELLNEDGLIE